IFHGECPVTLISTRRHITQGILNQMLETFLVFDSLSIINLSRLSVSQDTENVTDLIIIKMKLFCVFMKYDRHVFSSLSENLLESLFQIFNQIFCPFQSAVYTDYVLSGSHLLTGFFIFPRVRHHHQTFESSPGYSDFKDPKRLAEFFCLLRRTVQFKTQ